MRTWIILAMLHGSQFGQDLCNCRVELSMTDFHSEGYGDFYPSSDKGAYTRCSSLHLNLVFTDILALPVDETPKRNSCESVLHWFIGGLYWEQRKVYHYMSDYRLCVTCFQA